MVLPILLGFVLGTLCMAMHAVGTAWWIQRQRRRFNSFHASAGTSTLLRVVGLTLAVLTALHVAQILVWAIAYRWIPGVLALVDLEEALYFSLITFTTVGYGDVVIEQNWRLMAGIEALNGILLMGWSTAVLLAIAQRFWRDAVDSGENSDEGKKG